MIRHLIFFMATTLLVLPLGAQAQSLPNIGPPAEVGTICTTAYALCTSAPCIPDPDNPTAKALCNCAVQKPAPNYGYKTTCPARIPMEVSGTTTLISTYSFQQADTNDVMSCTGANYWTDCLDAPCVVDPRDPDTALCTCNLIAPQDQADAPVFLTYGGHCNTGTCATHYWSGATVAAFEAGSDALIAYHQMHGLDLPGSGDVPYTYCPAPAD